MMRALVAVMLAVFVAVTAGLAADAAVEDGCELEVWPYPRNVCPLDGDVILRTVP